MKEVRQRRISLVICITLLWNLAVPAVSYGADRTLTCAQAASYARQVSPDIKSRKLKLTLKNTELVQAVEAVRDTRKNKATIRYSLLFSIKWPENLDLSEEQELTLKGPQIENEIRKLSREIVDLGYQAECDARIAFLDCYSGQEDIKRAQDSYDRLTKEVSAMGAKVRVGKALQTDLEKLRQEQRNSKSALTSAKQKFEASKAKLSSLIKLDISSGYIFANPLSTSMVPRERLQDAVTYTLERDYSVYEAQCDLTEAQAAVDLLHSLYRSKFGSKYKPLEPYVNRENLDYEFYMSEYEKMLKKLDEPWDPVLKLYFFFFVLKIPFEWFKGELAGTRYMEDCKYALPTAMIERDNCRSDLHKMKDQVSQKVYEAYESMAAACKAYAHANAAAAEAKKSYGRVQTLNRLGKASFDETEAQKDAYLQAAEAENAALLTFNEMTFSFDRLTCGFISAYRAGELSRAEAASGESAAPAGGEKSMYYITDYIRDVALQFRISLAGIEASDYELWYDNKKQVGKRTPVTGVITHVESSFKGTDSMSLRLYKDGKLTASASFDPNMTTGELEFRSIGSSSGTAQPKPAQDLFDVGSYRIDRAEADILTEISFTVSAASGAAYYTITDTNGSYLVSADKLPVDEPFLYVSYGILEPSRLRVQLYDSAARMIGEAALSGPAGRLYLKPAARR